MAPPKTAHLTATATLGPETRFLALATDEPLGFVGGQYVIIDSGQVLPSGKACKRAYSILSSDEDQHRFELAVMRIPDGPGSSFVHGLEDGRAISFSGPWGKFFPAAATDGPTLVIATDTGITAALGLVRSTRFRPLLGQTVLVWLRVASDYFLPEAFVRDRIPAGCGEVRIEALPAIGHPDRVPHARALLRPLTAGLAQAFIAGDGAVNYALLDDLVAAGVPATRDNVDSFFNMPKKSA
jgi:ferredoxin-NADP reductase